MSDIKTGKMHSKTSKRLYSFDSELIKENSLKVVGIDEVGRGAFAGPVVAAAVQLNYNNLVDGVNDSKKLSGSKREKVYEQIVYKACDWSVGMASAQEIDKYNILQATFIAMKRAIEKLKCEWNLLLVDGNAVLPFISLEKQRTIVAGDAHSAAIASASIVAKVTRDRIMVQMDKKYPEYELSSNKGYGTLSHRNSIVDNGLCRIHRKSFCENLALQTRLSI